MLSRHLLMIALTWMLLLPAILRAQPLEIPADSTLAVTATVGRGSGTARMNKDTLELDLKADALGEYFDNTTHAGAMFDCLLPKPVNIPADARALGLEYNNPRELNLGVQAELRPIVRDQRGVLWALGTRVGIRGGRLNYTRGFAGIETYAFDINELGRVDRWVMTRLSPADSDEYIHIQPPLQLAGFRIMMDAPKNLKLSVRRVVAIQAQATFDPYWLIVPERLWLARQGIESADLGRYGWAPANPRPYLRAADLGLPAGAYHVTWEILASDQWKVLASDVCDAEPAGPDAKLIDLPLLPQGTYSLHLVAWKDRETQPREFHLTYVVVRNSETAAAPLARRKPIQFSGLTAATVAPGEPVAVTISAPAGAEVAWSVESQDRRVLLEGKSAAPVVVDLAAVLAKERVCWLTARQNASNQALDLGRRLIGLTNTSAAPSAAAVGDKLRPMAGKFLRTKGDWFEGATPVVSQSAKELELFGPWMKEAQETGYNVVELSAPWFDVNPLPGVYQFEYLDRLVAQARERGLRVVFRVHATSDLVPAWVPREFQEDQNHRVHGLWSGGNTLVYSACSKPLQDSLNLYLRALGEHFSRDPDVIGYTLSSLHFDHDWLDQPWLGQSVDYSAAARAAFIHYLRGVYHDDLGAFNTACAMHVVDWEKMVPPIPATLQDTEGRLRPRADLFWRHWIEFKVAAIRDFRLGGARALRAGDPACWIGLYASDTSPLYLRDLAKDHLAMTFGSMESQFPERNEKIPGRYEPHAKIARTATLVDVGLSNILLSADPGYHGMFNYWMPQWRLDKLPAPEHEAELRLKQWFDVLDRLVGARPVTSTEKAVRHGAYLTSFDPLLYTMQHTFSGRQEDVLKPFVFALGRDHVEMEPLSAGDVSESDLKSRPYVYVPYCTDVLNRAAIEKLDAYVRQGGRLIAEATSGYWQLAPERPNALFAALGLPVVSPEKAVAQEETRAAHVAENFSLAGELALRVRPFAPPINAQPTPWIHVIPGAYLRPYAFAGVSEADVRARLADGRPAVAEVTVGKGRVLMIAGVADWLRCAGLARRMDAWGRGVPAVSAETDPEVIAQTFVQKDRVYVVGRRFIDQEAIANLKMGKSDARLAEVRAVRVRLPAGRYRVMEVLSGKACRVVEAGVELRLTPGEAFVLEGVAE